MLKCSQKTSRVCKIGVQRPTVNKIALESRVVSSCSGFMKRIIALHPNNRYGFKPNNYFRYRWDFLPDPRKKDIIATQLTYLDFHGWLKLNLRHTLECQPDDWSELVFDVDEGFHRTDILLYAAICEAALHCILKSIYDHDGVNA